MTEDQGNDSVQSNFDFRDITIINVAIAILIPPIIGYFIILFLTNLLTLISRELWLLTIIWPEILYYGGIGGGFLGGLIAVAEISMYHSQNRPVKLGKIFHPDLYYVGGIMVMTYILEMLSESLLLQGVLFLLEILFICSSVKKS